MPERIVFRDAQPADLQWAQHRFLRHDPAAQLIAEGVETEAQLVTRRNGAVKRKAVVTSALPTSDIPHC